MIDSLFISKVLGVKHSNVRRMIMSIVKEDSLLFSSGQIIKKTSDYKGVEFEVLEVSDFIFVVIMGRVKAKRSVGEVGCEIMKKLKKIPSEVFKDALIHQLMAKPEISGEKCSNELKMHRFIVLNFNKIFPEYSYVGSEFTVDNGDKIDILGKNHDGKDVIFEIKTKPESAHKQLRSYAFNFDNPILVNVTFDVVPEKLRVDGILYKSVGRDLLTIGFEDDK